MLQCSSHGLQQVVVVPGLRDVLVNGTGIDRVHQRFHVSVSREEDPDGLLPKFCRFDEEFEPRHLRHPLVADYCGEIVLKDKFEGLSTAPRGDDRVMPREKPLQRPQIRGFVIDNEYLVIHIVCGKARSPGQKR